jgi:undecaprenyl pyrophosphate phosphatase UppP
MSKKEDNQFIRMLFLLIYGTIIGAIGYLSRDATKNELVVLFLVACIISCSLFLIVLAKKHKENSDEIED